jgi:hypothetical protein
MMIQPTNNFHSRKQRTACALSGPGTAVAVILMLAGSAPAQFPDWKHSGAIHILTTPEGADLPAAARVSDFPVLIRLHRDNFPFSQADARGGDIRFSAAGKPLPYEIERWDPEAGEASVWVRIPSIQGNTQQEIRLHWGKPGTPCNSDGKAVFNASNGYIGVWHLADGVRDAAGILQSTDHGTRDTAGVIGGARHFPGNAGISCGNEIDALPIGGAPHSSQAWLRPDCANGGIVAWGNEKRSGKVVMSYASPPHIGVDCYFSTGNVKAAIPDGTRGWIHAVHTYDDGQAFLYLNGEKCGAGNPKGDPLAIERPARMWIGGWYDRYNFVGEIDEVRISSVARSADWVRLEYQNQKPHQTLVGPVVQPGESFSVSPSRVVIDEGESIDLTAQAGGARKIYWSVVRDGEESVLASDRFRLAFDAGRVTGDQSFNIRFDAIDDRGVRSLEIPVTVKEHLPEPEFTLTAPSDWDGRETIVIQPVIRNLQTMRKVGLGELDFRWEVSGIATIGDEEPDRLILSRAQGSGTMTVKLTLSNGGQAVTATAVVAVREPESDAWVPWVPGENEMPVDGQFYARDDSGKGTLHCKGKLGNEADAVFLRVFADDKMHAAGMIAPDQDGSYAFAIPLDPGLVKYRIEFGSRSGSVETILHRAGDIVCGDAFLITGQSNALATDTGEQSPRVTHEWIRSYGQPQFFKQGERENLWCKPVWKAQPEHLAELGWWGMELAKQLVASRKIPVFILNGARGGTRIDQHLRNNGNPTDPDTIYGRMLWSMRQARLTHGIRAVIWHQGESDQGSAGPDGDYGWKSYPRYFVKMSADWKRDFPNISHYYTFQIWPDACSMGGGNGDMLREIQRTLPRLYSNMDVMSSLGIKPPGGCHYPLTGWSEFARLLQPLIERDFHGLKPAGPITPANLKQAYYTSEARDTIALEFDQPVVWDDLQATQFHLDDTRDAVVHGEVTGNLLTLTLNTPATFQRITYLKEMSWKQESILMGRNGIAALTFCRVPVLPHPSAKAAED